MGCNLSRLSVWNQIADQTPGDYFLVLEDDVRFHPHWVENWRAYAANIPLDAELLYLGGVLPPNRAALPKVLSKLYSYKEGCTEDRIIYGRLHQSVLHEEDLTP